MLHKLQLQPDNPEAFPDVMFGVKGCASQPFRSTLVDAVLGFLRTHQAAWTAPGAGHAAAAGGAAESAAVQGASEVPRAVPRCIAEIVDSKRFGIKRIKHLQQNCANFKLWMSRQDAESQALMERAELRKVWQSQPRALPAASAKLGNIQLSQKAKTAGTIESTEESDDKGGVDALKEVNGEDVVNFGKAAFDMGKEARNSNVGDALKQLPGVVQQGASLCAQVAGALEAVSVTAGCGGVSLMASVASSALNGEDTAGAMDAGMQQLADKLRQTKEDIESQIMQSTAKLLNAVTTAEQHLSQNSQEKRQYLMEDVATFVTNLKSGRKMPDLYLDMQKMQHRFNKTGLENYLRDLKGAGVSPDQILTAAAAFLATRAKIMLLQGSAVRNTDEVKRAAADFQSDIEGMKKVLADFQDLRLTHTLADADDWILSVAWAPDGRLAVGGNDNKVRVYDEDLRLTHTLADAVMSVAWAPDGRLAAGGLDHKVRVYDEDLRLTRTLADADDWIISVAWAPDGRLAVGGNDNKVRVYDEDLRLTHTLADAVFEIHFVAWAPDGRLAAGGDDNKVRVYDEDLRLTHTLADADFAIHFVAWAPDGRLAAGGDDHKVRVYDEVEEETWNNSKAEASLDQNMLDLVDPYNKGVVRYAADSLQRAPSDHLRKGAELDRRPEARRRSGERRRCRGHGGESGFIAELGGLSAAGSAKERSRQRGDVAGQPAQSQQLGCRGCERRQRAAHFDCSSRGQPAQSQQLGCRGCERRQRAAHFDCSSRGDS
ncbi:unnamed protein product [Effrenium voratum]|uniref:Anaphase-promoting complex subunit 4 WD40 domain-containing protein n=1 Tax=Effrenium voratum TaxID=2562239 RepID=A0AA36J951_9DINO|nr:unnamed protein product [Effrenium voratum]